MYTYLHCHDPDNLAKQHWSTYASMVVAEYKGGFQVNLWQVLPIQQTCFVQIPGGWAAQRWGGRRMLMVSFSLWSTASLLTPATAASTSAIMLARVAVGIAQGFLIPSVHTVLSQVT